MISSHLRLFKIISGFFGSSGHTQPGFYFLRHPDPTWGFYVYGSGLEISYEELIIDGFTITELKALLSSKKG